MANPNASLTLRFKNDFIFVSPDPCLGLVYQNSRFGQAGTQGWSIGVPSRRTHATCASQVHHVGGSWVWFILLKPFRGLDYLSLNCPVRGAQTARLIHSGWNCGPWTGRKADGPGSLSRRVPTGWLGYGIDSMGFKVAAIPELAQIGGVERMGIGHPERRCRLTKQTSVACII